MIDRGASLSDLMMLMIGCCIFSLAMPLIWFNLFGLTHFRKPS
jgi:Golgi nucleoside diphosphatase